MQTYHIAVTSAMKPNSKIRVPIPGSCGAEKMVLRVPPDAVAGQVLTFSLPLGWADARRKSREGEECEDAAWVAEMEAEHVRLRSLRHAASG